MKSTVDSFRSLCANIHDAHVKHVTRKHMKLDEDPWENYLYYDSKHLLPLICHNQALPIEKQIIIARFIEHAMEEEIISQFKLSGQPLVEEFLTFVSNFENNLDDEDADEDAPFAQNDLLTRIREACSSTSDVPASAIETIEGELSRVLRMFYLHMRMQRQLKPNKEDYFI